MHVDDWHVNGAGGSLFRAGSPVQVQPVQAMCTWVWGRPVETTGRWDADTRATTSAVLARTGVAGALTDGVAAWHRFLDATLAQQT